MFMIMPVVAGVLLLLKTISGFGEEFSLWGGKSMNFLLVGFLFAIGFLFKVPVVFDLVGVLIWLSIYRLKRLKDVLNIFLNKNIWWIIAGFLAPVVLTIIYYYWAGAGEAYVRSALGQNIGYLSSWEGEGRPIYENGLFQRGIILIIITALIILWRKKLGKTFGLAALWFSFALFGALLSGRPYPHYLIEIVAPAVILVAIFMSQGIKLKKYYQSAMLVILFGLLTLGIYHYKFWYYKSLPYYVNFAEYITGQKSYRSYLGFFGDNVLDNHKIASYIRSRTDKNDRIYVWGTEPAIYALSKRLPVGRYTVSYHVRDFNGFDETIKAFGQNLPRYVVVMRDESEFPELKVLLSVKYILVNKIGKADIWRLQINQMK
jgi:hypothetical protein